MKNDKDIFSGLESEWSRELAELSALVESNADGLYARICKVQRARKRNLRVVACSIAAVVLAATGFWCYHVLKPMPAAELPRLAALPSSVENEESNPTSLSLQQAPSSPKAARGAKSVAGSSFDSVSAQSPNTNSPANIVDTRPFPCDDSAAPRPTVVICNSLISISAAGSADSSYVRFPAV